MKTGSLFTAALIFLPALAFAYPEYQVHIQETSGRNVNCAMCHASPDGPEGAKAGQIGSLNIAQLDQLARARTALEPGQKVHNPILNEFGNALVEQIGRQRLLTLKLDPENLAAVMSQTSDADGDGLADAREVREGTDPLDPNHGNPWALARINFERNWFHLLMAAVASFFGLFALNHLLHGLHLAAKAGEEMGEESLEIAD